MATLLNALMRNTCTYDLDVRTSEPPNKVNATLVKAAPWYRLTITSMFEHGTYRNETTAALQISELITGS